MDIKITYKDTVYGFRAMAKSKVTAWMLIRNKCHEKGLVPPLLNQVEAVR